jgi:uncharacterized protein YjbJ (UPF0337 family)
VGIEDKISDKAEDLGGQAKEGVGNATGNDKVAAEGKGDQAKSSAEQAGEKVKDAFS